jgi:hypothetical protein
MKEARIQNLESRMGAPNSKFQILHSKVAGGEL